MDLIKKLLQMLKKWRKIIKLRIILNFLKYAEQLFLITLKNKLNLKKFLNHTIKANFLKA
jgi:hypothetical protein